MSSIAQRELMWFVDRLAELQKIHAYTVTSWWRTVKRNEEVGGMVNSLHLSGLAVDCVLAPGQSKHIFLRDAKTVGLHGLVEGDHVHLQARGRRSVATGAP